MGIAIVRSGTSGISLQQKLCLLHLTGVTVGEVRGYNQPRKRHWQRAIHLSKKNVLTPASRHQKVVRDEVFKVRLLNVPLCVNANRNSRTRVTLARRHEPVIIEQPCRIRRRPPRPLGTACHHGAEQARAVIGIEQRIPPNLESRPLRRRELDRQITFDDIDQAPRHAFAKRAARRLARSAQTGRINQPPPAKLLSAQNATTQHRTHPLRGHVQLTGYVRNTQLRHD